MRLYDRIDRHALAAASRDTSSVARLASYLRSGATHEREVARAIFRWITENVTYDFAAYMSGQLGAIAAPEVLRTRSTVCSGYANLFAALAAGAGLETLVVTGLSRSSAGTKPVGSSRNRHAWNAVKVFGQWQLLDCTWGAGHIEDGRQFVRSFNAHYFLTQPAVFACDHFPDKPAEQFLVPVMSQREFEEQVARFPPFFLYRIGLQSHRTRKLEVPGSGLITLDAPDGVVMRALLYCAGAPLDDSRTFSQREGSQVAIRFLCPAAGEFRLLVFAGDEAGPQPMSAVLEYQVESDRGSSTGAGFPLTFSGFACHRIRVLSPVNGTLRRGVGQLFRLEASGVSEVAVVCGEEWTFLKRRSNAFEGIIIPTGGEAVVCVRPERTAGAGASSYPVVLRYAVV